MKIFVRVQKCPWDDNVNLRTLEISFDPACNLKCSYCNPAFSTAWVKDINTYGAYQNIQSDGRGHFVDTGWAAILYLNKKKTIHIYKHFINGGKVT